MDRNEYCGKLGRVKVTYDKVDGNWMCDCSKNVNHKRSCPHRYLENWFLHENMPSIMKSSTVTQNLTGNGCAEETEVNETGLSDMNEKEKSDFQQKTSYLMTEKMYPLPLPDPVKFNDSCQVNELIPVEEECCFCLTKPKLGKPTLVNKHAKVLGLQGVVRDIAVYSKVCPQCGFKFRYQEWTEGLHNFNDSLILTFKLCDLLQSSIQEHIAPGSLIVSLLDHLNCNITVQTVRNAFLHYLALCSFSYDFNCLQCGYYPSIIISDVNRKCVFSLAVSELEEPKEVNQSDTVDADKYWDALKAEIIARGFLKKGEKNPIIVKPSYGFWAPWIGRRCRKSNMVTNSEHRKVHLTSSDSDGSEEVVSEDVLFSLLSNKQGAEIKKLCREAGVSPNGTILDCVLRLRSKLSNRIVYDKVFSKIWGASGGWLRMFCQHGISYYIKSLLRAESPHDHGSPYTWMVFFPFYINQLSRLMTCPKSLHGMGINVRMVKCSIHMMAA